VIGAPLRVGVAGCGRVAERLHLPLLAADPAAAVVAVADPHPGRRAAARRIVPGAAEHADLASLLTAPLDAVVLALPTGDHAAAAVAAFAAGHHVYVEKPLATEPEDGRAVVAAWRASRRTGMVGLNARLHPAFAALRTAVRASAAGRLVAVRTAVGAARRDLPAWKAGRASGGGVLLDLVTHHADLVPYLLDDPVAAVRCTLRSVHSEDDTALVELRLRSGLPVHVLATMTGVEEDRVEVYGDRGRLAVDRIRDPALARTAPARDFSRRGRAEGAAGTVAGAARAAARTLAPPAAEPSFARALGRFVAAARSGTPATPDPVDGLRSLLVVAAAERSARSGGWVDVDPGGPGG